jgi:DNA repair protein RecO (recombination protein O)
LTHSTKALILRAVKYGETSLIVTAFTEIFGLQSYIVKGVRTHTKKGTGKAGMFQPGALLEMEVYHQENKNLQFIKEFRWSFLYRHIFSDVIKNSVALYMVELLLKCLKHPEENADLYGFVEDCLLALDGSTGVVTANFPVFFALHLATALGFQLQNDYSETHSLLDLHAGRYRNDPPAHLHYLDGPAARMVSELLRVQQPPELAQITMNRGLRRQILDAMNVFYNLHVQEFGTMKTLAVLQEVMG